MSSMQRCSHHRLVPATEEGRGLPPMLDVRWKNGTRFWLVPSPACHTYHYFYNDSTTLQQLLIVSTLSIFIRKP